MPHHGNYSIYAVADQMLWRDAGQSQQVRASVFARVMDTPQGDRNLIDFSANAGIVYARSVHRTGLPTPFRSASATPMSAAPPSAYDRDVAAYNA